MRKHLAFIILVGVVLLFFYKTILYGKLPFPGDLLLAGYAPWNHQSYDGYVAGALPTKDQYFDVIRELYPWKTVVVNELKKGNIPLWNPYNFSGAPLLANYQSQALYPFGLLYFILPQDIAWTLMVIIQPLLGAIFLYLFATEIGLTSAAAVLAAILFNFSSFASVWMEFTTIWQTIMWLPLLLYLVERQVKQKKLFVSQQILFIFALFSAITAGHPQDFINVFLLLSVYVIARKAYSLFLLMVIPFFLAAPQLLPTTELFRNSARVAHDYTGIITHMLVQWWQLPLVAVQDFFGNPATRSSITGDYVGKTLSIGIVGLSLALSSLWVTQTSWHKKFFMVTAAVVLLLVVRSPISEIFYRYPWPILSTGTPTRVLFVLMLSLSLLAGLGYDSLLKSKNVWIKSLLTMWGIIIALWGFALVHPQIDWLTYPDGALSTMKRAMILATILSTSVTVVVVLSKFKRIMLVLLIPLAIGELFYGFNKFNPFVPPSFVFPKNAVITKLQEISGIDRFWGYGTAAVEANFATQERLYSTDGTDPLHLVWYNQFMQSSKNGNIPVTFNRTTRSDATLAPGYGISDLPDNQFRLRVMDVVGVKYILDRAENPKDSTTFAPERFNNLGNIDDWTIYENRLASARFFITGDVRPYTDTKDFEQQFFSQAFVPGKTVLVHAPDFSGLSPLPVRTSNVTLRAYTPTKVTLQATADAPGFLFLSDTYDTGWNATVNGTPSQVYKANFAFRGIIVPQGTSTIVFSYTPQSFQVGVIVSLIALAGTTLYFVYQKRVRHRG